jgi:hypothetical protein
MTGKNVTILYNYIEARSELGLPLRNNLYCTDIGVDAKSGDLKNFKKPLIWYGELGKPSIRKAVNTPASRPHQYPKSDFQSLLLHEIENVSGLRGNCYMLIKILQGKKIQ